MWTHAGIQKMSINRSSSSTPVFREVRHTAWQPPAKASERLRYLSIELPCDRDASEVSEVSVSLVLPCFNEELNIEHTIRDVQQWFSEEHVDGEVIVTDDGST